jgi:hypothetical protein
LTTILQDITVRTDKWVCITLKKALHSKRKNEQSEETAYTMGEILARYSSHRGLVCRIYKYFLKNLKID